MKRLLFTVTNDLRYDQRMGRICGTLATQGYEVVLIGRKRKDSPALVPRPFQQKRLRCWFSRGPLFYAEYNIRLFFFLLFQKADLICGIDMDTLLPVYCVSRLRGIRRVYDAHEFFSQMEEVISRPRIYRIWHGLERWLIPRFPNGYTVCLSIAEAFEKEFGVRYSVIRNLPHQKVTQTNTDREPFLLYQGAVNKGRGLEQLLEAMDGIEIPLVIAGDGNAMQEIRQMIAQRNLSERVRLTGMLEPEALRSYTSRALIGINPFQRQGLNQYFSLANKFFDYIQAGLPQVTMNYPEYARVNGQFEVAVLINDLLPETIAKAVNNLYHDPVLYNRLRTQCLLAATQLTWENEEVQLVGFFETLFRL